MFPVFYSIFYIGDIVGWTFFAVNREGGKRTKICGEGGQGGSMSEEERAWLGIKRNITHRTFDKETATSNSKVTMPAVTGDKSK